ncbi:DUF448 domain-containing protein [Aurantiacibacter spongiae]|uniref:DUF448 domain-containing protein n=1 Tax=Aurantiacibacter spongiae TaxID=2488860 RepID=A0A3N5CSI3_9SPHN|nr:DUF448 domain-containing protein [Aurantiacibacter spongiae]RPF72123.1 DUF448 domain-containing protein [Aurantiacibacter spongiae]
MRNPRNDPLGSPAPQDASARPGQDDGGGSERRCVLTGSHAARDALIRLAGSPPDADGAVHILPDAHARAPGRGAWIGVDRPALERAMADGRLRGALARAFRTGRLAIPDDLPARIEAALTRAFLDRLGLEMRTGRLILGSDRIAKEARMGKVAALYHAADASEDGARKLDQAWRMGSDAEGSGLRGTRLPLDRDALSVALGRDNVVHLALADTRSAQRVEIPLGRLQTFLAAGPPADTSEDRVA